MPYYCDLIGNNSLHQIHHDREHGFPQRETTVLFERLVLEIFQPGLSWLIVLKKREGLKEAFHRYNLRKVAHFSEFDVLRLLQNRDIIRNRRKVESTIENAKRLIKINEQGQSFYDWLMMHRLKSLDQWIKLMKGTFVGVGASVTHEFLMSVGLLPGAHRANCPVYENILKQNPLWASRES